MEWCPIRKPPVTVKFTNTLYWTYTKAEFKCDNITKTVAVVLFQKKMVYKFKLFK